MKIGRVLLLLALIAAFAMTFTLANTQEATTTTNSNHEIPTDKVDDKYKPFVNPDAADKPFMDQKDMARIETCMGPCLSQYAGAKEFIMKRSMYYTGLQTLFVGEYPKLVIYDTEGTVTKEYDLREMNFDQIDQTLAKHGLHMKKTEL